MGLFEHFPYTNFHRLNFDWLVQKVKNLLDRMDQAEEDIDDLQTRMSAAEDDIDALETRMQTAEDDIDALETRMQTAEDDIDDLQTRMSAAEDDIDSLEVTVADHAERIAYLEGDNEEIWRRILPNIAVPFVGDLSEAATSGSATRLGNVLTVNYWVDLTDVNVEHKIYFKRECVIPFGPEDAWSGIPVLSFRDATTGDILAFPIVRDAINGLQYFTIPSGTNSGSLFGSLIIQWNEDPVPEPV